MGSYESFKGAAKRFQEHYGFEVERNAVRREVEAIATLGQQYIEHRLDSLKKQADDNKYPVVVEQLVSAAIDQGMGTDTEVTAVADGGNGLREALERGFPKLKFIQGSHSSQTTYLSN